jgi:hypothetical protein
LATSRGKSDVGLKDSQFNRVEEPSSEEGVKTAPLPTHRLRFSWPYPVEVFPDMTARPPEYRQLFNSQGKTYDLIQYRICIAAIDRVGQFRDPADEADARSEVRTDTCSSIVS